MTAAQRDANHLIARMLDDLYWVMSYSRWKDERYWGAFRDALLREHPKSVTEEGLNKAKEFNAHGNIVSAPAPRVAVTCRAASRWRLSWSHNTDAAPH